jgi:cephalosporin hydroxylase
MSNANSPADQERPTPAIRAFADALRRKIDETQHGVPTFADHVWLSLVEHLERGGQFGDVEADALHRLQQLVDRRGRGRFVDYIERLEHADGHHGDSDVEYFHMVTSQGAAECLQWKGMPLFKTAYDFSLYPMLLWELRPRTIVELGSGAGASAVWLADTAATFGLDTHVYSVDLRRPEVRHDRVTFMAGDCEAIAGVFDEALLRAAPHPWLVIEDAHVDVGGVLSYFHGLTHPGDYVIVEDSDGKRAELQRFFLRHPGAYKVDTRYTDFFGRNATCAPDSILVRTGA